MTNETSKAIATSSVWISTAIILAFGLFRMDGPTSWFVVATITVMLGAVLATSFIWRGSREPRQTSRGFEVIQPAIPVEN